MTVFANASSCIGEQYNIIIDVSAAVGSSPVTADAAGDRVGSHCGYCGIMGLTQSIFHLPLPQRGKPAKILRDKVLPLLLEFLVRESRREGSTQSILVISEDPGDVSVAITLFVLSLWYNDAGKYLILEPKESKLTKHRGAGDTFFSSAFGNRQDLHSTQIDLDPLHYG